MQSIYVILCSRGNNTGSSYSVRPSVLSAITDWCNSRLCMMYECMMYVCDMWMSMQRACIHLRQTFAHDHKNNNKQSRKVGSVPLRFDKNHLSVVSPEYVSPIGLSAHSSRSRCMNTAWFFQHTRFRSEFGHYLFLCLQIVDGLTRYWCD